MYVTLPTEDVNAPSFVPLAEDGRHGVETRLRQGAYLFFEGDTVEWLYQITSGVLRLTRLLRDGRRQVIAFGYPGDIIGFPAAGVHHTDCEALTDARLQPYRLSHLETGLRDPQLHRALLDAALKEISDMQDHFMMLGRKSATEKLASFLIALGERVGEDDDSYRRITLPMSRADIGDFLGLTTETVSRTFTQLRKSGIIAIENVHTVIVLRPRALRGLAACGLD